MNTDVEQIDKTIALELRRQAQELLKLEPASTGVELGYQNAAGRLLQRAWELDPEGVMT